MIQHDAVQAVLDTILVHTPHSLEAQHALLDAIISALCLQLVRVQAVLSARAPISQLPDDILTQIFTYAVYPSSVYASTTPTAISIAGTNRRWRTIALSHPALWTRVDLRHPSAPYALVYSRRLGLEVRLDAPLWKLKDASLARILAPHVNRVKQLWIQTASVHIESFLKSIAKSSQLERLVVTGRYTDDHPLELSLNLLPRLRHLTLTHVFLAPSPVPSNLLSLSLKPPHGAPPIALPALADLLKASPNLTDLALFGNAVPVYKPGDTQHERTDLVKLKTLKVAGVNPVQAAWLLFHLSHPSNTLLALELEPSRPLRTLPFDRPRAPDFTRPRAPGELESYYAIFTMFRSGAIPLDTVSIGPAVSENKQQQVVEVKPTPESKQPFEQEEDIITEKLAANYTSALSTLALAAGSRATEALARLLTAPVPSVTKLCIINVKLGLERLDEIKRGQDESQIRSLEIRACSLPVLPKGERSNGVRNKGPGGPPPTPSQTSPTSGQPLNFASPPSSNSNLNVPSNGSNGFSNPYSSTGFPTSSSSSPTPTNPPIPTPGPQPNIPIWTPYTTSHELVTPTSAGAFMPFYAGVRGQFGNNPDVTGANGDTLNSPASSEDDTTTTDTAVPEEGLDTTLNPDLSSSVHSASGDTTLASIASSEDAVLDEEEEEEGQVKNQEDETSSEISDTDAVVNLNASETVGERRRSSLPTRARPGKLRDEIVAKLRDDVIGKLREDIIGKMREDKARAKEAVGASSTVGTAGTGSGTSTPLVPPASHVRGLPDGQANGTSGVQLNGNGVNGVKPPLPSTTSAPLLSTTNLPPINAPQQPPLNRIATAPQLDQLRLKSNYLRPSNSSSNLRRPLGFAPYATSVAVTGFTTTPKPAPSRSPTFPFLNQPSFHTLQHPDDPDIRLLIVLSFHMPQLEELRIVRSTIRGSALIKFVESRNNCDDDPEESDSDSDGGRRAGPGTPILMLELVECPYVSAEHVRVLRESVDDVRWKAYTYVGGAGGV